VNFKHHDKETLVAQYAKLTEARNIIAGMRSSIFLDGCAVDKVTLAIVGLQDTLQETLTTGVTPDEKRRAACPKCNGSGASLHGDDCPSKPLFEERAPSPSIHRQFMGMDQRTGDGS